MTITVETQPYEILIRYAPDGSIAGAHWKTLRVVRVGNETLSAQENIASLELPQPLEADLVALMATLAPRPT